MTARQTAASGAQEVLMSRFDLTSRLVARLRSDEAVVGGIGNNNFDLWATGRRPQNFYMLGSMGLCFPIALGLALTQPRRRVVAIEGDGSLLMQLGCLATIAERRPANLTLLVMDNGSYQITGGQKAATHHGADLVTIARGCGLNESRWAENTAHFEELLDNALIGDRPHLIAAKIDEAPGRATTDRDPAWIRDTFMRGLGTRS
ncbi:thiamine pyrophosphate-dependent enzyme [Dongia deserti]|uniref:thiamine pyrophosphate-dependent enzyme n=1 Tax=Dongia deserti TaxID=2268030 RepID=UPI000E655732|nr:thiamine pyrophosphate-dependent enzyme [Dongia deserti]